jgi:predicted CxxxxCH...CXXCH cytochrome family protein
MAELLRRHAVFALGLGLALPGCLERRDSAQRSASDESCTSCHGDPRREADALARSAPPRDLFGQHQVSYPGVGAHAFHVTESATHAAIACGECHRVPERVDSPGHIDDLGPAEVLFGALARSHDRSPVYDARTRTCQDSYCHGEARPVWTSPRESGAACGSCHGLPPPLPHPQSERCSACHGDVIDDSLRFLAPARHPNGIVDFAAADCSFCHGSKDSPAPDIGAHQAHLRGGRLGRAVECGECHAVPETVSAPGHLDDAPAEVVLTGVAESSAHRPSWNASDATCGESWCHSPSAGSPPSPPWNADVALECTTCHGLPPTPPHPQLDDCSSCHGELVAPDNRTLLDVTRHVDGVVDTDFDRSCTACHGDTNPAPPRALSGETEPSSPGVGAHQLHLLGTERSRAVPCGECHSVPAELLDPGHVDSRPPAEVVFSGAASAFGGSPTFENGTCRDTSCHGGAFPKQHQSGGTWTEPSWTDLSGRPSECGSCHGLPPPPPHPHPTFPCHACHGNLAEDDVTFVRPELHVDGKITLAVE